MTTAPAAAPAQADDVRDPGWVRVGQAVKEDRQRRGWTRVHLVQRATSSGKHLTERTLTLIEQGRIDIKGGASPESARLAYTALGWTEHIRTRIQVDGTPLPPLPDLTAPRRARQPASTLTTSLMACRPEQVARLDHELAQCVEKVRAELIRLGMALTLPGTDSAEHHAAASRMARHLVTTRVTDTLAQVEDSDYTAPHQEGTP
jgi:hypothetical protein